MHEDEKYIVFKREDVIGTIFFGEDIDPTEREIKDAVVIRTQDVFAASGLRAYAENIRAFIGITRKNIQTWGPRVVTLFEGSGDIDAGTQEAMQLRVLEEVALYFEAVAHEAEDRLAHGECKVPD
jgi:hypothetical protein